MRNDGALECRVALFNALGKDGWTDQRVSLPRFKKAPKLEQNPDRVNSEYVTNNLPQLDLPCGTKLSQSHAIARRLRGRLGAPARSLLGGRARRCGWVGSGATGPVGPSKRLIGVPTPSLGSLMSLRRARVRRCVYGVSLFARV